MIRGGGAFAGIVLGASVAYSAGPFDGKWNGSAQPQGDCRGILTIEMTIVNGIINGAVQSSVPTPQGYTRGTLIPAGPVAPDGTVNVSIGTATHYPAVLRFTGDGFAANINSWCGLRTVAGTRTK